MPLVVYTLLRFALLAVAYLAIWWAGAQPVVAAALAIVVATAVSYLFLRRQRDASAAWLADRAARRAAARKPHGAFARGVAADEAAEDGAADGAYGGSTDGAADSAYGGSADGGSADGAGGSD